MNFEKTALLALAHHVPDTAHTSDELEEKLSVVYDKLKLPKGRLELMTGIKERRLWPVGTRPSDLSTRAALNLKEENNQSFEDVDLLIHASVCRDFLEPSTASVVHANLSLNPGCMIFDLSNACLGVINGITMAAQMIERGQIRKALIVSGENGGPLVEDTISGLKEKVAKGEINRKSIKKYIANLTIGSAATAILLGPNENNAPLLKHAVVRTDSSANILCQGDGNPHGLMMETDSEALMLKGVALAKETWAKFKEESGWREKDLNWVLTHQVGKAHEELTLKTLECQEVPTFRTYPYFGNTGSSALPLTLSMLNQSKDRPLNQTKGKVALMGIGSGLTSIILGLEWGQL